MIRVNLVEHLTSPYESLLLTERSSKKPIVMVVALLVLLIGGGVWWWSTQSDLSPSTAELAVVSNVPSVKQAPKPVAQKRVSLASQRGAMVALVNFFERHTSVGIAYTDLVLQASGNYFLKGLADDSSVVTALSATLRKESAEYREGPDEAIGASRRARSFVRYGRMSEELKEADACSEVAPSISEAMKKFDALMRKSGLKVEPLHLAPTPQKIDDCQEVVVERVVMGRYPAIASALRTVARDKFPVGISQLKMSADPQEQLIARLEMVVRFKTGSPATPAR